MDYDFQGKRVLVTGSSRGIGAGIVQAFAKRGARCVVNYVPDPEGRNQSDARSVADGLPGALVLECDVGDASQVEAMMSRIRQELGGLDILVNNAGILRDRTMKKLSDDEWNSVLRVNLTGTFNCTRQAAAGLLAPGGRIVNLSSVSGQIGIFGQANYAASKAGIIALTKVAARELARQSITVNAVAPGFINTSMSSAMPDEVRSQFIARIPAGVFGEIEDIVAAVLFLASAGAAYITGQVLNVNGGFHM